MSLDRLAEAEAAARTILKSQFKVTDPLLTRKDQGRTNYVFEAPAPGGLIVLRVGSSKEKAARFARELCVIECIRSADIPAPEVIGAGEAEGWAYMAVRWIPGLSAIGHPRRRAILEQAARLAATRIHRIATGGFGHEFSIAGVKCGGGELSWSAWLDDGLGAADRLEVLAAQRILTGEQFEALAATLDRVRQWQDEPVLNHGDLRLKNLIVDEEGSIVALLDWEGCVSAVGPHWDLSVALHDLGIDEKEAFLTGYGLPADAVREFAPVWRLFNALNYVPHVKRVLKRRDEQELERIRNRFSGSLDLYAG